MTAQNKRTPLHFTVFLAAPCHLEGRKLASFGPVCHMSCAAIGQYFTPAGTSPILTGCGSKKKKKLQIQLKRRRGLHRIEGFLSSRLLEDTKNIDCRLNPPPPKNNKQNNNNNNNNNKKTTTKNEYQARLIASKQANTQGTKLDVTNRKNSAYGVSSVFCTSVWVIVQQKNYYYYDSYYYWHFLMHPFYKIIQQPIHFKKN